MVTTNDTDAALDFKQGAKWGIYEAFRIANSYGPMTDMAFEISAEIRMLFDE